MLVYPGMKILLVALNARYVHTNLAVRYLREVLLAQGMSDWEIGIREFSINERVNSIAAEIYEEKPDMLGFSCYIWNISQIGSLIRSLRPVMPEARFFAGGPEVSYDAEDVLRRFPELDAVVSGEAENSLPPLIKAWQAGQLPTEVQGLVWRLSQHASTGGITSNGITLPSYLKNFRGEIIGQAADLILINEKNLDFPDLNQLPNPYALAEDFKGRLVYVETSRGCPFNCEFCISSTFRGIRYLEPEKFRLILRRLLEGGAQTVKFVDRTFNANKKHAFPILDTFREEAARFLDTMADEPENTAEDRTVRAHCEMAGELLDEEWLAYLQNYPPGMIQVEIGVQSTHPPTLALIRRPQHFALWKEKVRFLQHSCQIPVHLDLIAGLPGERWQEFRTSFNEVFDVRPDNLQLGFLKVLKGSGIWRRSAEYGLIYSPEPPYTILQTRDLTHGELLALARIEEILEKYYNSGRFRYSLALLMQYLPNPFDFFHHFAQYWQDQGLFQREWNMKALFAKLYEFIMDQNPGFLEKSLGEAGLSQELKKVWPEALRFDYYLLERPGAIPPFLLGNEPDQAENLVREAIRSADSWRGIIKEADEMDRRQWARATAVDYFAVDIPELAKNRPGDIAMDNGVWFLFFYGSKGRQYFRYEERTQAN